MKAFLILSIFSITAFFLGGIFLSQSNFIGKFEDKFGGTSNYSFAWTHSEKSKEKEEDGEIQVANLTHLVLNVDMGKVKITPNPDETKKLIYRVKYFGEESPLNFKREGEQLELTLKYKNNKKIFDNEVEVEVLLPRFEAPISLDADIKIGSLRLAPGLYFSDFNVDMSAGEMRAEALSFSKGDIDLSAGELRLKSTDLKEADLSVSGGSMYLETINSEPKVNAEVNAGKLKFGTAEGVDKNFTVEAEVSIGEVDLVEGYTKSGDKYVYGNGKGKVELEVDLGEVEVF